MSAVMTSTARGPGWVRTIVLVLAMAGALAAAEAMRPTIRLSEQRERIDLGRQVPSQFGEWREDKSLTPVLPNPEVQAKLDTLYSQVLARTYVNARGERVMLSIAYGSDQSSEATAVHRPEFCYSAQGFRVRGAGVSTVTLPSGQLQVQRLVASMPPRQEPISYWVTLDQVATLPGLGRKLQQLRYGLKGQIADGMLVRVSNIGADNERSFGLHDDFMRQLREAMSPAIRARYFGS